MKQRKFSIISAILSLLAIPLISAYTWSWNYLSPQYFLDNEWTKFGIIFILLFLAIYTFFIKRTHQNKMVSGIAGAGISLLLIVPIMRRGLLEAFLGDSAVDWILIICTIIIIFFLISWFYRKLRTKGLLLGILVLALIPAFIDLNEILPSQLVSGVFGDFLDIVNAWSGWIAAGVIIIFLIMAWRWWKKPKIPGQNVNVNQARMSPRQIAKAQRKAIEARQNAQAKAWKQADGKIVGRALDYQNRPG